jgi:hypothetical protein
LDWVRFEQYNSSCYIAALRYKVASIAEVVGSNHPTLSISSCYRTTALN